MWDVFDAEKSPGFAPCPSIEHDINVKVPSYNYDKCTKGVHRDNITTKEVDETLKEIDGYANVNKHIKTKL